MGGVHQYPLQYPVKPRLGTLLPASPLLAFPGRYILNELVMPCVDRPLPPDRIERDRVLVTYSAVTKAVIEDDTISLHYRHADELYVKLAISFALAESTKLSVFEEDLRSLGRSVSYLPAMMAGERLGWDHEGRVVICHREGPHVHAPSHTATSPTSTTSLPLPIPRQG